MQEAVKEAERPFQDDYVKDSEGRFQKNPALEDKPPVSAIENTVLKHIALKKALEARLIELEAEHKVITALLKNF
jgi:hypothetical protein